MAAPKGNKLHVGNKYAVGNNGGRPRVHEPLKLADELIEWAKQEDSINLNAFCCTRDPLLPYSSYKSILEVSKEFSAAHEIAKQFIAYRRESWLNEERLHVKSYDLNALTYDQFLKEEKRQQCEFEANLRKQEEAKAQQIIVKVSYEGLGSGIGIQAEAVPAQHNKVAK